MEARTAQPTKDEQDRRVAARCRGREPDAWPELVGRFSPYVYAIVARGYRLSEHDAQDVFQEVFLRTWQRLDDLHDDAAMRPWIAQITRRLAIDRLRANARQPTGENIDELADEIDQDVLAGLDEALSVRQAMARLPFMQRDILERVFVRDQSHRTAAAELGIAEGTVASRISRARDDLRAQLTDH